VCNEVIKEHMPAVAKFDESMKIAKAPEMLAQTRGFLSG